LVVQNELGSRENDLHFVEFGEEGFESPVHGGTRSAMDGDEELALWEIRADVGFGREEGLQETTSSGGGGENRFADGGRIVAAEAHAQGEAGMKDGGGGRK